MFYVELLCLNVFCIGYVLLDWYYVLLFWITWICLLLTLFIRLVLLVTCLFYDFDCL